MEITVLGCHGPFPAKDGATSGYLITLKNSAEKKYIMVDCGSGTVSALQRYINLEQLDMVILTHMHSDHSSDLGVLNYAYGLINRTSPVEVYAPEALDEYKNISANRLSLETIITGDNYKIEFFPVIHPVECYGMRITENNKTFVYTSDTVYFDTLYQYCTNAEAIMTDGNFVTKLNPEAKGPHMTVSQTALLAKKAGVHRLYVTHISPLVPREMYEDEASQFDLDINIVKRYDKIII